MTPGAAAGGARAGSRTCGLAAANDAPVRLRASSLRDASPASSLRLGDPARGAVAPPTERLVLCRGTTGTRRIVAMALEEVGECLVAARRGGRRCAQSVLPRQLELLRAHGTDVRDRQGRGQQRAISSSRRGTYERAIAELSRKVSSGCVRTSRTPSEVAYALREPGLRATGARRAHCRRGRAFIESCVALPIRQGARSDTRTPSEALGVLAGAPRRRTRTPSQLLGAADRMFTCERRGDAVVRAGRPHPRAKRAGEASGR